MSLLAFIMGLCSGISMLCGDIPLANYYLIMCVGLMLYDKISELKK